MKWSDRLVVIPLLGNIAAILPWLVLFRVPAGTPIRPMGECMDMVMIAAVTALIGLPLGFFSLCCGRWRVAATCILLSLTPIFVGVAVANILSFAMNLRWED